MTVTSTYMYTLHSKQIITPWPLPHMLYFQRFCFPSTTQEDYFIAHLYIWLWSSVISLQASNPHPLWDLNHRVASVSCSLLPTSSSCCTQRALPEGMLSATCTRGDGSTMRHTQSMMQRAARLCGRSLIARDMAGQIPCTSSIGGSPMAVSSRGEWLRCFLPLSRKLHRTAWGQSHNQFFFIKKRISYIKNFYNIIEVLYRLATKVCSEGNHSCNLTRIS